MCPETFSLVISTLLYYLISFAFYMNMGFMSDKYSFYSNLCKETWCSSCTFLPISGREHLPAAGCLCVLLLMLIILCDTVQGGCDSYEYKFHVFVPV